MEISLMFYLLHIKHPVSHNFAVCVITYDKHFYEYIKEVQMFGAERKVAFILLFFINAFSKCSNIDIMSWTI